MHRERLEHQSSREIRSINDVFQCFSTTINNVIIGHSIINILNDNEFGKNKQTGNKALSHVIFRDLNVGNLNNNEIWTK